MIRCLVLTLAISCAACFGSARDKAVVATNTTQSVLSAVDEVWSPIVQQEIAKAHALDDAGYKAAMAPYMVIQEVIEESRRATQLLNLAVQTWDAQADEGAMFREVVPCVVQDLQLARALLKGQPSAPVQVLQALTVIEAGLEALAKPGAKCAAKAPDKVPAALPLASAANAGVSP